MTPLCSAEVGARHAMWGMALGRLLTLRAVKAKRPCAHPVIPSLPILARLGVSRDDGEVSTHFWIQSSRIPACTGQEEAAQPQHQGFGWN